MLISVKLFSNHWRCDRCWFRSFPPENQSGGDGDSVADFGVVFDENDPEVGTGSRADLGVVFAENGPGVGTGSVADFGVVLAENGPGVGTGFFADFGLFSPKIALELVPVAWLTLGMF